MQDRRGGPGLRQHTQIRRVRLGIYSAVERMGETQRGAPGGDQGPRCAQGVSAWYRGMWELQRSPRAYKGA